MGIFDYVNYSMKCPKCGAEVSGFQTKDGDVYMNTVEYWEVSHFYSSCDKCGAWIDIRLKGELAKPPHRPITDYVIEVRED